MYKHSLTLLALLLLGSSAMAQSADNSIRIGYADPELIIQYMPDYRSIQEEIQREVATGQQALQALAEDFQERVERYEKQRPLLTPERQQERESELAQLQNEIRQSAESKDEEIAQREQELMAPLLDRVQTVIDRIATANNLDVVMRSPALLYVNEDRVMNLNLDIARELGIEIDEDSEAVQSVGN
ncbi:MAG: hypothetical protein COV99_08140 [Bacteroidetes bacterium CG12_big_fil_rev_8_21_14_0_65_60_17]|nr:MAG: hypothetical protein COV99_08140 [Bacteroidetes bacterium CG12_big_fil_rev_8_21_14_0_65_60_17]